MSRETFGTLCIYSPQFWHDSAIILGDRDALTQLRDALNRALDRPETPSTAEVFAPDGEGYHVLISERTSEEMFGIAPAYTNTDFADRDQVSDALEDAFKKLTGLHEALGAAELGAKKNWEIGLTPATHSGDLEILP